MISSLVQEKSGRAAAEVAPLGDVPPRAALKPHINDEGVMVALKEAIIVARKAGA